MKKIFLLACFLVIQKLSFAFQNSTSDTTLLRIDPRNSAGGTCSTRYSEITYIPIENSKRCVIDEISKLTAVDKYFIVFDRGIDQIVILNRDGSFHAKCNNIPGFQKNAGSVGNPNYNMFGDFAIQSNKKQIIVRSNLDLENLYIYNYDGLLTGKINLKNNINAKHLWGYAYLDNTTSIYSVSSFLFLKDTANKQHFELFISDHFASTIKNEIPYDPNKIAKATDVRLVLTGPFYQSGIKDVCFFTRPYDYNIYKLNAKGIANIYKILFPIDISLPTDFLVNENKYKGKRLDYLNSNRQKIYSISNVYSLGDNIYFKINSDQMNSGMIYSYNLKTGSILNLIRVSPDISSSFLPVINNHNAIQACDGQNIYTSLSSFEIFRAYKSTKEKSPVYPTVLQNYFNTQSIKSNPVIVKLRPKL